MNALNPHAEQPVLHAGAALHNAQGAIILLHGRGGSADDILGLAGEFGRPGLAYLAPQAAGYTWYPQSFVAPREANEPWLTSALSKVAKVVDEVEQAGIPRERILIAGFSQGACLTTEFAASTPARYAGLIAFTGGLIGPLGSDLHHSGSLAGTPALLLSGDPDPHVPWQRVQESGAELKRMGAAVETIRYPGRPHTISHAELEKAREMLERVFPVVGPNPIGSKA